MSGINLLGAAAVLAFVMPHQAGAINKDELLSKYRNKFVVVTDEGISIGLCPASDGLIGALDPPSLSVMVKSLGDVKVKNSIMSKCAVEPVRKGEVLRVYHVAFSFGYLLLNVRNVSPHSISRGIGAFAHQSLETGTVGMEFRAGNSGKDMDAADILAAHWLKPFDTAADAAKLGNTATGVFVNQVKAGMSFAEVEAALGVPQTRVDLGEKVLYKYKDLTVEFYEGKLTDVR
jgi:hypothetical protein